MPAHLSENARLKAQVDAMARCELARSACAIMEAVPEVLDTGFHRHDRRGRWRLGRWSI